MIKIENVVLPSPEQMEAIIRGCRNPYDSWAKSDSYTTYIEDPQTLERASYQFFVGEEDAKLMTKLARAGSSDHRKFMRMMVVYLDITAPFFWWKEFDTYKVGTVANSCSTMHTLANRDLTVDDFSCDGMLDERIEKEFGGTSGNWLKTTLDVLNFWRRYYKETGDKLGWRQMIEMLPNSFNQRRTVMLNYEVLANIYRARKGHKLVEWETFREWVRSLPHSYLITGEDSE